MSIQCHDVLQYLYLQAMQKRRNELKLLKPCRLVREGVIWVRLNLHFAKFTKYSHAEIHHRLREFA